MHGRVLQVPADAPPRANRVCRAGCTHRSLERLLSRRPAGARRQANGKAVDRPAGEPLTGRWETRGQTHRRPARPSLPAGTDTRRHAVQRTRPPSGGGSFLLPRTDGSRERPAGRELSTAGWRLSHMGTTMRSSPEGGPDDVEAMGELDPAAASRDPGCWRAGPHTRSPPHPARRRMASAKPANGQERGRFRRLKVRLGLWG